MSKNERPNIVLFVMDQCRANATGYWGNPVIKTPHVDSLAKEGAGFKWCFVQNPVSTPSRVAMASGWYCHVRGHRTMHYMLRRHEPNMLRYFKDAGYHVWWGGKNDMIAMEAWDQACHTRVEGSVKNPAEIEPPKPGDRLFYSFLYGEVPENFGPSASDDDVARRAAEFIGNPTSEPFFMLVNQSFPHPPYAVPQPFYSMYDRAGVPAPIRQDVPFEGKPKILRRVHERMRMNELTEEELREIVAIYYGMISKTDRNLGWILEALKSTGRWDNTVVVVTSDHGDFAGDYQLPEKMQNTFEDVLTNVPFVIRVPDAKALPAPSEALVEMVDLLPTLLEVAGIELRHTQFGRSLMPLISGETDRHRQYVFSEGGALATEVHTHESDRGRQTIYWPRTALQFNEPRVHGKAVMIRSENWKYVRRLYDTDELYDMADDPQECHNRVNYPALADVRAELDQAIIEWFLETGDAVPLRWDMRSPREQHPPWSANAPDY